ncbi:unnamed protein product [Choristocarpus tenellus]
MAIAPFDVAKIRYQLDVAPTPRYANLRGTLASIYSEEGLISLWRGNTPAMFLWVTYTGVQFGVYGKLQQLAVALARGRVSPGTTNGSEVKGQHRGGEVGNAASLGPAWNGVCGAISGGIATIVSYPLDITRTALAYQGVPKRYPSMVSFIVHTAQTAGPTGFFRGMSAALTMIAPQMGVGFAVYEAAKANRPRWLGGYEGGSVEKGADGSGEVGDGRRRRDASVGGDMVGEGGMGRGWG